MSSFTVFISGASRGIGLGLVREFLKHSNFRVVAACRNPAGAEDLRNLQKANRDSLIIVPLDVTSVESHKNVKRELSSRGVHSIDILIANAGIGTRGSATTSTVEAMKGDFETNVVGTMLTLQTFMDFVLASRLRIFSVMSSNLGSIAGAEQWGGDLTTYRVSKAALNMYAVNFAGESKIRDAGCKTLILHPGWVQTDMGGPTASITTEQSCAGLFAVFQTAMEVQHPSSGRVSRGMDKLQRKLINGPLAYVDYAGNILPW